MRKLTRWLRHLAALEPALVRGAIGLAVAGLLIWGVDLTPLGDKLQATTDVLGGLVAVLAPLWIRQAVTPAAAVIARVNDPRKEPEQVFYQAGGYADRAPGRVIYDDATFGDIAGGAVRGLWRDR